jgi:hypothetical protein
MKEMIDICPPHAQHNNCPFSAETETAEKLEKFFKLREDF